MVLHSVIHFRLPEIAGLPEPPHGLLAQQLLLLAAGLPGPLLLHQFFLPVLGDFLPVQLPVLLPRPLDGFLELVDGGLDALGVVRVRLLGGLQPGDLPPGEPCGASP